MKVGDKVQLRRTIIGIYPYHVQIKNEKGIARSYINWEWQQLISKEGMEGVESWRRKG